MGTARHSPRFVVESILKPTGQHRNALLSAPTQPIVPKAMSDSSSSDSSSSSEEKKKKKKDKKKDKKKKDKKKDKKKKKDLLTKWTEFWLSFMSRQQEKDKKKKKDKKDPYSKTAQEKARLEAQQRLMGIDTNKKAKKKKKKLLDAISIPKQHKPAGSSTFDLLSLLSRPHPGVNLTFPWL